MERVRGPLDGVGAEARQARGAQRPPPRLDRDQHVHDRPGVVDAAAGRPLRGHARRGHAPSARSRRAARRDHGAPAEPAPGRSADPSGDRRSRRPPAAHHGLPPGRARGVDLPADLLRPGRDRSVLVGGLRRLPGHVRRGHLHREGHLRRRCLPCGAGQPRTRQHAPEPRPVRRDLRSSRSRH